MRASGATVNNALPLVQALDKLGMPLYGMQTPNGYSWMSEPWVSTGALVSRMNFALVLSGDRLPGVRTDWTKLLGEPSIAGKQVAMESGDGVVDPEVAAKEKKLEQILLGQPLSEKTRAAVLSQSNDQTAAIQAAKEFQLGGGGGKDAPGPLALAAALAGNGPGARAAAQDRSAGCDHGGADAGVAGVSAEIRQVLGTGFEVRGKGKDQVRRMGDSGNFVAEVEFEDADGVGNLIWDCARCDRATGDANG